MNFDECLQKGFIRKDEHAKKFVSISLKKVESFLKAIPTNISGEHFDVAVLTSYNAIFCMNQALLFNKGFIENSHVCLIAAIKEIYSDEKELLELLDAIDDLRLTRHKIQYTGYDADAEIVDFAFGLAEDYFDCIKKVLKV